MAQGTYKKIPADQEGIDPGQLVEIIGEASFSGTGTTVEVIVGPLTVIHGAIFTPKTVTMDQQDAPLGTDGVIGSGAITVARLAAGSSGLTFYFQITGQI